MHAQGLQPAWLRVSQSHCLRRHAGVMLIDATLTMGTLRLPTNFPQVAETGRLQIVYTLYMYSPYDAIYQITMVIITITSITLAGVTVT